MGEILYQGHASFRIVTGSGLVFYIDPWCGGGYDLPADVILVTHEHPDHNAVDLVPQKPDCTIIRNADCRDENGDYNYFDINDVHVEAVPAYGHHHPKEECVGFVMEVDGRKLYFAGDTNCIPEMKQLADRHLDVFFVPTDGVFTMDLEEARQAAEWVGAMACVPIHNVPQYGEPEKLFDKERAEAFDAPGKLVVRPGENIIL